MATESSTGYKPGDRVPEIGIYECEGHAEHSFEAQTLGEFPPLPEGCEGGRWVLVKRGPIGPIGFSAEEVAGAPEA
jgi:hypothetical protein